MRFVLLFAVLASPLHAWEFSPVPICTVRNDSALQVEVTFDGQLYSIHLTRPDGWPQAAVFALRFDGPAGLTISTDRHRITGNTLTVTDRGFGNVLNGIQFNSTATALIGDLSASFDLTGAAPAIERFRDCPGTPVA